MTAPIRQKWSDEMIDARVGDVVSVVNPNSYNRFKNSKIINMTDDSIQVEHDGGFSWVHPDYCTLISREFQVGDVFEWFDRSACDDTGYPCGAWIKRSIDTPALAAHVNKDAKRYPKYFRHANPLWRTKSED